MFDFPVQCHKYWASNPTFAAKQLKGGGTPRPRMVAMVVYLLNYNKQGLQSQDK